MVREEAQDAGGTADGEFDPGEVQDPLGIGGSEPTTTPTGGRGGGGGDFTATLPPASGSTEVAEQPSGGGPLEGQRPTGERIAEQNLDQQPSRSSGGRPGSQQQIAAVRDPTGRSGTPTPPGEQVSQQELQDRGIGVERQFEITERVAESTPGVEAQDVAFREAGGTIFVGLQPGATIGRPKVGSTPISPNKSIAGLKRRTVGPGIGRLPGSATAEDLQAAGAVQSAEKEIQQLQAGREGTPGFGIGLTPSRQRFRQARTQAVEQSISEFNERFDVGFERGQEFRLTETGDLELTADARRRLVATELVRPPEERELEGTQDIREVDDLSELEFNEEGELTSIQPQGGFAEFLFGPPGTFESAVGGVVSGGVGAAGEFASPVLNPIGAGVGTVTTGIGQTAPGQAILGPPSQLEQDIGTVSYQGARAIGDVGTFIGEDVFGTGVELAGLDRPSIAGGEAAETFVKGLGMGAADILQAPNVALQAGEATVGGTQFAAEKVSEEGVGPGLGTAAAAGVGVTAAAAQIAGGSLVARPVSSAGALTGGALVGGAVSPVRVSRFDVPTSGGGTATLRGVRLTAPKILERRLDIPGRTIAGTREGRPTLGTPSVRPGRIDFDRFGERLGAREPVGRFETDVTGAIAARVGPEAKTRFDVAASLVSQGGGGRISNILELTTAPARRVGARGREGLATVRGQTFGRIEGAAEPALQVGEDIGFATGYAAGRGEVAIRSGIQRGSADFENLVEPGLVVGERAGFATGYAAGRGERIIRSGFGRARTGFESRVEPALQAGERAGFATGYAIGRGEAKVRGAAAGVERGVDLGLSRAEQGLRTFARASDEALEPIFRPVERGAFAAGERFGRVQSRLGRQTASSQLDLTRVEDILGEAEDVPAGAEPELSTALIELDAEIFGSGAVRAQLPGYRTPRDIDIAVSNRGEAKARLSSALEESGAEVDVDEVFDIKTFGERASPGELVKFGRLAQRRLQTKEGLDVTPAGEELMKKAGAGAFIRGRETPAASELGTTGRVDIGPEPVAEGAFVRVKDPADASVVATELARVEGLGTISPFARSASRARAAEIRRFREEFEPELERATAEQPPLSTLEPVVSRRQLSELFESERAQAQFGLRRAVDVERRDTDVEPRDVDRRGSSVSARGGFDPAVPVPTSVFGGRTESNVSATAPDGGELPPGSPVEGSEGPEINVTSPTVDLEESDVAIKIPGSPIGTTEPDVSPGTTGTVPESSVTVTPTSPTPGADVPSQRLPGNDIPVPVTAEPLGETSAVRANLQIDEDDKGRLLGLGGVAAPTYTDFTNPLTGATEITDRPVQESTGAIFVEEDEIDVAYQPGSGPEDFEEDFV